VEIQDLKLLWDQRASFYGQDHADMDRMIDVYMGGLPDEFDDMFHEEMHVHLINMIRLAWDDLAWLAGKEFPIYVPPEGNTTAEITRAERLEKWGYGVNAAGRLAGGVTMKSLMKILAWWMVGCANAVAMVLPDFKHKTPYLTWRDPRTFYPPVGWTPWNETQAEDSLFVYQKSIAQLRREYPDKEEQLRQAAAAQIDAGYGPYPAKRGPDAGMNEDETWVWVGEYYHPDCWLVGMIGDQPIEFLRSETGDPGHPGVNPVASMGLYSPVGAKGRSIFADQVSIQAAMARMFSQKLDFYDRTLYPIIFTSPLSGKNVKIGPFAVNEWDTSMIQNPRVDTVGPTNAIDADQTMAFAQGMSRMLNRNPEQMQGVGDADSAKALEALRKGVNDTIREGIWPSMIEALPVLYSAAAEMDQNLWGRVTKKAKGRRKNANFTINYTPRKLLKGHEHDFEVEPGVGLQGFQGTQEIMMLVGAELMSEDDALEQLEHVREPIEAKRRIQSDRAEKLMWAKLNAVAAADPAPGVKSLKAGAISQIRRRTREGEDMFDVIDQMEAAGQLYEEPVAPPDMNPLAALLGGGMGGPPGGGAPPLPPPEIAALGRGA
jgi:hypothetical protein